MDTKYFQLVNAIVEKGSMSSAAEMLNLTPSALSHQLKELESGMDSNLFHRVKKKLVLTEEGEIFYKYGREILGKIRSLRNELDSNESERSLTISMDTYTNYYWLSELKSKVRTMFPFLKIKTHTFNHHNSQHLLEDGSVDMVISGYVLDSPGYIHFPVKKDRLVLICPADSQYIDRNHISVFDLNELGPKLISHCFANERHLILEKTFQGAIIQKPEVVQYDLTDVVIHNIRSGEGFGVFSEWAITPYITNREHLLMHEFREDLSKTWYAIFRKDENTSFLSEVARLIKDTFEFSRTFQMNASVAYA